MVDFVNTYNTGDIGYTSANEDYYREGGLINQAVGKSLFYYPGGTTDGLWVMTKSVTGGVTDAVAWYPSNVLVQGSAITNATSAKSAVKFVFGTNLSGNYDTSTGIVTVNAASGSGGLTNVQSATSIGASRSLVYSVSSGVARLRGIGAGSNIAFDMMNESNAIVTSFADCTWLKLRALMQINNISFSSGICLAQTSSDHSEIQVAGIRAGANVTITLEVSGSSKNYVIASTGGGGGSGMTLGSNNSVTTTFGLGMIVPASKTGYLATGASADTGTGYYANDNLYGYVAENCNTGMIIDHCVTGLALGSDSKNPLNFAYYGTTGLSSLSGMSDGSLVYGNFASAGQGLYMRVGSNLLKVGLTNVGAIP